jgi:hypothetical protein
MLRHGSKRRNRMGKRLSTNVFCSLHTRPYAANLPFSSNRHSHAQDRDPSMSHLIRYACCIIYINHAARLRIIWAPSAEDVSLSCT